MSSAVSSLKGTKRTPLPPVRGVREVRSGPSLTSLDHDIEGVRDPNTLDFSTRSAVVDELRKCRTNLPSLRKTPKPPGSRNAKPKSEFSKGDIQVPPCVCKDEEKNGPATPEHAMADGSDADLVSSMAGRLAMVERELLAAKREIIEKGEKIVQLEEKVSILSRSSRQGEDESAVRELKQRCLEYQKQLADMEEFLDDYGMVWVGREEGVDGRDGGFSEEECPQQATGRLWDPQASVAGEVSTTVNFDAITKNIKDLNVMAGEGQCEVAKSGLAARLQPLDPIPLTLYKNGLAMHSGPFRPYSDPLTQQFITDLQDGYFPSELKDRYPEGIPFQLKDMRDKTYVSAAVSAFHGGGHRLGGQRCASRLLPSPRHLDHQHCHDDRYHGDYLRKQRGSTDTTSELPVKPVSLDTFLKRLPTEVLRNGRVINIRSDIEQQIKSSSSDACGKVVVGPEPPAVTAAPATSTGEGEVSPSSSCGEVCTLRVKSDDGGTTYVLKLRCTESVGELKKQLNNLRPAGCSVDYVLRCSYPKRILSDDSATLHQVGLFSSANLFIEPQSWT